MKKIVLFILTATTLLLAGCYTNSMRPVHPGASWNGNDFHNQMVNTIVEPNSHLADQNRRNYKTPRKYVVTRDDQQKYNNLNSRISKRLENLQQNEVKGTSTTTTHTQPMSATPTVQVPSSSHHNATPNTEKSSTLSIPSQLHQSTDSSTNH